MMKSQTSSLRYELLKKLLALAPRFFHFAFQRHGELANSRLVHRLDQAQRFVQHSPLMFRPVRQSSDAAKFSSVKCRARHFTLENLAASLDCRTGRNIKGECWTKRCA